MKVSVYTNNVVHALRCKARRGVAAFRLVAGVGEVHEWRGRCGRLWVEGTRVCEAHRKAAYRAAKWMGKRTRANTISVGEVLAGHVCGREAPAGFASSHAAAAALPRRNNGRAGDAG